MPSSRHLADAEWFARDRLTRISHLLGLRSKESAQKPGDHPYEMRPASLLRMTGGSLANEKNMQNSTFTSVGSSKATTGQSLTGTQSTPSLQGKTSWTRSSETPMSTNTSGSSSTNTTTVSQIIQQATKLPAGREIHNKKLESDASWLINNGHLDTSDLQQICNHLTKSLTKEKKRRRRAESLVREHEKADLRTWEDCAPEGAAAQIPPVRMF